jgi:hypothetical protein
VPDEKPLAIPVKKRPDIEDYSEILDRTEEGDRTALPRRMGDPRCVA